MNTKLATTTLIVLSSLMASTSFAGDASAMPQVGDFDVVRASPPVSTLTREAVKADYLAAAKVGTFPQVGDADVVQAQPVTVTVTRQAVIAEFLAARKAGTLPRNGELS